MTDLTENDAQDQQIHPAVKPTRAIVSVAFARSDFDELSDRAERSGMKLSEFIRASALKQLHGEPPPAAAVNGFSGSAFRPKSRGQEIRTSTARSTLTLTNPPPELIRS